MRTRQRIMNPTDGKLFSFCFDGLSPPSQVKRPPLTNRTIANQASASDWRGSASVATTQVHVTDKDDGTWLLSVTSWPLTHRTHVHTKEQRTSSYINTQQHTLGIIGEHAALRQLDPTGDNTPIHHRALGDFTSHHSDSSQQSTHTSYVTKSTAYNGPCQHHHHRRHQLCVRACIHIYYSSALGPMKKVSLVEEIRGFFIFRLVCG